MQTVWLLSLLLIHSSFAESKTVTNVLSDLKFETKSFLVGQATVGSTTRNINADLPKLMTILEKTKVLDVNESKSDCAQICRVGLQNGSSFANQTVNLTACKNNWGLLEQANKPVARFDSSAFEAFCKVSYKRSKVTVR